MIGNGGPGQISTLTDIVNGSPDSSVNKFGFNNDVDTLLPEDIWSNGGLYPYATFSTAQTLEFLSSSANDAPAGTGAEEITIIGLDDSGAEASVVIATNGVSVVAIPGSWLAINRAFINNNKTGSLGINDGNINIRVSGGGTVVSQIPAARGQTQQCVYRVPVDGSKVFRVVNLISYTDAATGKTASMQLIKIGTDCQTTRVLSSGTLTEASRWQREYKKGGPKINALEWVAIRAFSVAQNDTAITADFDGVLE